MIANIEFAEFEREGGERREKRREKERGKEGKRER